MKPNDRTDQMIEAYRQAYNAAVANGLMIKAARIQKIIDSLEIKDTRSST